MSEEIKINFLKRANVIFAGHSELFRVDAEPIILNKIENYLKLLK
jgi:hypothetical protein